MTRHLVKLLLLALGFAVVLAFPADAKTKERTTALQAGPGISAQCRGGNLFRCGPVYNGRDYLGDDPDPFIRLMIQRDLGAKYGGAE
jgi:hypothetical protein